MKVYVILFIIGACNSAVVKPIYRFPAEQSQIYLATFEKCAQDLGYDDTVMQQMKQSKYTDDDRVVESMVCANVKLGYCYPSGRLYVDKTINDLFPTIPEVPAAIDKCEKDYGADPVGTFKAFLLCFRDEIPFKVLIYSESQK